MLETLNEYKQRTSFMYDSLPSCGTFCTSEGLRSKIYDNGSFKSFYGNTIIFSLPKAMIEWLADIQNKLYDKCGFCLAERINSDTFHITEHDLLSNAEFMPDFRCLSLHRIGSGIYNITSLFPNPIQLKSTCLFSMVGTSVVMGFEPRTEETCLSLMQIYEVFQKTTVHLPYPLTLHTTIAYYKPGNYDEGVIKCLKNAFEEIGREQKEWDIDLNNLNYATFESMNSYKIHEVQELWQGNGKD